MKEDIKSGIIRPLKATIFKASDIEQSFRYLASGKHIGKILLKIRENDRTRESLPIKVIPWILFDPDQSYIIPGGMGGFGMELIDWMVMRGCKKFVLSSSRGVSSSYQNFRIR